MDFDAIWNSIITIKIRKDDSYNLTLREIETYAKVYGMTMEAFCTDILKLSGQQIYNLKNGTNDFVKCLEYKRRKQEFFERQASSYRLQVVKEKIKTDYSRLFSLEELEALSTKLSVNIADLCANVLGISKARLNGLKRGEYREAASSNFKAAKTEYLKSIENSILEDILNSKKKTDFSREFSYNEITEYSTRFGINTRDFLGEILGINSFGKQRKPIDKQDRFWSEKYNEFKHKRMQTIGEEILDDFIIERMKRTGDYRFEREEIERLSEKYNINMRDFMVYVLGKSEQLYYDMIAGRVKKCFSQKYSAKRDEIIVSKRENFMSEVNPNIRTYYSMEDLERLASTLEISTYDLIVNVMKKSRANYYRVTHNYRNGQRVSMGEHKAGPLPDDYCRNNIKEVLEILRVAVRSAIGYMKSNGYKCATFYNDLLQEAYIYIAEQGNPMDENGYFTIISNKYEERHGAILYKKAYFNAINNIKNLCVKENTGEAYEFAIKTHGVEDEIAEDEDICTVIKKLSDDDNEQRILRYFSENALNDETMKKACKLFKVSNDYIQAMFAKLRERLTNSQDLNFGAK